MNRKDQEKPGVEPNCVPLSVALVLDHAPADDGARAKLADIARWLFAQGARHVTVIGAGDFEAPRAAEERVTLIAAGRGRAAVVEAVHRLIACRSEITRESLNAEIERLCGPAPDLILLIGETPRLDDSFAWNAAYAELYLLRAPWEALSEADIAGAIRDFAGRDRRFGALGSAVR